MIKKQLIFFARKFALNLWDFIKYKYQLYVSVVLIIP